MRFRGSMAALAALACLCAAGPGRALETDRQFGEASFKFLKLPLSPRVVGMGGAGSALADGAGELDLNPAAPAADTGRVVAGKGYPFGEFMANSSHITWSIPYQGHRILLNARYLGFDDIPGFSDLDKSTSAYSAHTLKVQAGLAGTYRRLQWGATLNYAGNNIAEANYSTAMANAGLRFRLFTGLYAGVSLTNADFWEAKAEVAGNANPFPPTALQAGLAYARSVGGGFDAALAVDARTRNDEKLAWPMGAEVSWQKILFARVGFPVGEQEPGLAAGLGLRWSPFQFQYAYQGHANLSPGHYWSLDIRY